MQVHDLLLRIESIRDVLEEKDLEDESIEGTVPGKSSEGRLSTSLGGSLQVSQGLVDSVPLLHTQNVVGVADSRLEFQQALIHAVEGRAQHILANHNVQTNKAEEQ